MRGRFSKTRHIGKEHSQEQRTEGGGTGGGSRTERGRTEGGSGRIYKKKGLLKRAGILGAEGMGATAGEGMQWVWGFNPVMELLVHAPQKVLRCYLAKGLCGSRWRLLEEKAQAAGVVVEWAEREALDEWTRGAPHQGMLARVVAFSFLSEEALLGLVLPPREDSCILLLDGIEDPQNFGAIARTSLALGLSALVIGKNRATGITPAALKASAGALVHLPIAQVTNLCRLLERLKKGGYWSLAATPQGSKLLWEMDGRGPWVVVIGGEGRGIGPNLLKHCDLHLRIPMSGFVSSLNASVSGGIVLYELFRQRKMKEAETGGGVV
ncbi:MAG: 23S rRNA (guanosine(2251)-2'-O)-methyltransferase RlmB [Cystobacterineae bacterium]|nr:23S rRNA (guanosine(2251)-2'-O)-methyltransferase RlmB [Cystobacterineae bacterium]